MNTLELNAVTDWLIDGARSADTPSRMMAECCERLVLADHLLRHRAQCE